MLSLTLKHGCKTTHTLSLSGSNSVVVMALLFLLLLVMAMMAVMARGYAMTPRYNNSIIVVSCRGVMGNTNQQCSVTYLLLWRCVGRFAYMSTKAIFTDYYSTRTD